jgi:hypothetical protein
MPFPENRAYGAVGLMMPPVPLHSSPAGAGRQSSVTYKYNDQELVQVNQSAAFLQQVSIRPADVASNDPDGSRVVVFNAVNHADGRPAP